MPRYRYRRRPALLEQRHRQTETIQLKMAAQVDGEEMRKSHLRTAEAAALIGISPASLNRLRRDGDGPPAARINARVFRFRLADVEHWLKLRTEQQMAGVTAAPLMPQTIGENPHDN